MKKFIIVLAIAISTQIASAGTVVQCDPGMTGSPMYPNVICDSNGMLQVNVSSWPTSFAISNLPTTQSVSGSVSVSNLPVTQPVSGSVTVSNFPTTQVVSGSVNVVTTPATGVVTNRSGSITTGGTSQQLAPANSSRKYFIVQNTSSANLAINFTNAASLTVGSIVLIPNASFVMEQGFISTEVINVIGATTGQTFTAKEF